MFLVSLFLTRCPVLYRFAEICVHHLLVGVPRTVPPSLQDLTITRVEV